MWIYLLAGGAVLLFLLWIALCVKALITEVSKADEDERTLKSLGTVEAHRQARKDS